MRRIEGSDYQRVTPRSIGVQPRSRIAVLYASARSLGQERLRPGNGPIVGSDTLVEQIRRVRDDATIKAIVLRVDSPGGSSVASDVIWRELMITRDQKPSRPLIASMSDLAASGGYYIAAAGAGDRRAAGRRSPGRSASSWARSSSAARSTRSA